MKCFITPFVPLWKEAASFIFKYTVHNQCLLTVYIIIIAHWYLVWIKSSSFSQIIEIQIRFSNVSFVIFFSIFKYVLNIKIAHSARLDKRRLTSNSLTYWLSMYVDYQSKLLCSIIACRIWSTSCSPRLVNRFHNLCQQFVIFRYV